MEIYFKLDSRGYVAGWGSTSSDDKNEIKLDLDDNHDFFNEDPAIFYYEENKLIKDNDEKKKLQKEAEKEENESTRQEVIERSMIDLAEKLSLLKGDG